MEHFLLCVSQQEEKKHVQDIENKDQLKYMTLEIRIR